MAHANGLKNIIVSNGYQSTDCLNAFNGLIDAANIDLKAFHDDFYKKLCGAHLEPVLETLKYIKKLGWWLEVTTLIIPGLNDSKSELEQAAQFIAKELSQDTPWHLSRFHPQYKLKNKAATPKESLEMAYAIGKKAGLNHVYLGNVLDTVYSNTFCPVCKKIIVQRQGFTSSNIDIKQGHCTYCGQNIAGIWN